MNRVSIICLLLLSLANSLLGEIFPHHIYASQVQTLQCQVYREGEEVMRPYPIARLGSDEVVIVSFDLLDAIPHRIYYKIELCNADWQVNELLAFGEYLSGWIGNNLWQTEESKPSEETHISYRHYELRLGKGAELQPLLSGNYRVTAWCDEIQSTPLFVVGFALYEPLANLSIQVVPTTPEGNYTYYQQVGVSITFPPTLSSDPLSDLLIIVGQNDSSTRYQILKRPTSIAPGAIIYEGYEGASFAAGNEWRAYELLSERTANMGVEHISFNKGALQAILHIDHATSGNYVLMPDANGYRKVRQTDYPSYDDDLSTEYYWVTWRLDLDDPLAYGIPLLEGGAFDALTKEQRTLHYNTTTRCFELTTLVKGGYVSYRYTTTIAPSPLQRNAIEGDYYQTNNQYSVLVYHTSPMLRYQRLVAVG